MASELWQLWCATSDCAALILLLLTDYEVLRVKQVKDEIKEKHFNKAFPKSFKYFSFLFQMNFELFEWNFDIISETPGRPVELMCTELNKMIFELSADIHDLKPSEHWTNTDIASLCKHSHTCMWMVLWTARVRAWQNPFPHSPHLKGFSFEWIYLEIKMDNLPIRNIQALAISDRNGFGKILIFGQIVQAGELVLSFFTAI